MAVLSVSRTIGVAGSSTAKRHPSRTAMASTSSASLADGQMHVGANAPPKICENNGIC
jgi:hypothetical protein